MIAIFIRLFRTRIVASKFLGPSFSLGDFKSLSTSSEDLLLSEANSSKSVGFSEKKATSDPEISALQSSKNAISPSVIN